MTPSSIPPAMTQEDFDYLQRLASAAADSGLYGGGAKTKAQLLMKLIYGRDLQICVSAALSGIDIYDGKMELSSNLIAALLEAHPHYAYAVVASTDERCELEFFKDERSLGSVKFDAADAMTAGLADSEYYRQYPSDMFFARAMTRGARRYCPGLGRGVAIYATGELAKRTPQPTSAPGAINGRPASRTGTRGAQQTRATKQDTQRIRALGAEAKLADAELFNVLVVAAGREPVKDDQRAARQLERALECLPESLLSKVIEALEQRKAACIGASATNGGDPRSASSDNADR
jgi:hypothetical protein